MSLSKLSRGTYSDRGDKQGWSYWDTFKLDHVTTNVRMFQTPWSGIKTRDYTNMKTAGQVPANQHFRLTSISVQYIASAARTTLVPIYTMLASCVGELIINGKDASYQKTLAQTLGLGFAVENATGAANVVVQPNIQMVSKCDRLRLPIILAANVPFEFDLTFTKASAAALDDDLIKVVLNGELIRAM